MRVPFSPLFILVVCAFPMLKQATCMSSTSSDLIGKRVLVTGAGKGIGRALARALYQKGARVALVSRTQTDLDESARILQQEETKDTCTEGKNKILVEVADVTNASQVESMVKSIVQKWQGLEILINNAGRGQSVIGDCETLNVDEFLDILDVNVVAAHRVTAACIPHLANGGSIVNISSRAGKVGLPKYSFYVASKFALEGLTACWATELKDRSIRVNSFSPGMVNTDSFPKPPGRPGVRSAESAADGVLFLLSTDVTGHYLHANELDEVRKRGLPDGRALKPIDEPEFISSLPPSIE